MTRVWMPLVCCQLAWSLASAPLPSALPPLPEHHLESRLLELTNAERMYAGVPVLAPNAVLTRAARHHAEEMVRLGYFGHVSPTDGRRTVDDRVALSGGALIAVGENLAAVSVRDLDVAESVIGGWMASAGHRANLLQPSWTHVGFGLAEGHDRRVYVVQVFAAEANPLEFVHASWSLETSLAVRMEVSATRAGWLSLGAVQLRDEVAEVAAGDRQTIVLAGLSATVPTHLRLGWTTDRTAGFIGQQSGWFDPATRMWTPDWQSPNAVARVERYASTDPVQDVDLQLAFKHGAEGVMVFVDGAPIPVRVTGTNVVARLPGLPGVRSVEVGTHQGSDERVLLAHRFELVVRAGVVEVR